MIGLGLEYTDKRVGFILVPVDFERRSVDFTVSPSRSPSRRLTFREFLNRSTPQDTFTS